MARYFYDHSVGESITLDNVGQVCRDDQAALAAGKILLASLLSLSKSRLPWQHFELIVRREDGVLVGRIGMTIIVECQNLMSAAVLSGKDADGHAR